MSEEPQVRIMGEAGRRREVDAGGGRSSLPKALGISCAAAVFSALAVKYFYDLLLAAAGFGALILSLAFAVFFLVAVLFQAVLVRRRMVVYSVTALAAALPLAFFYGKLTSPIALAGLAAGSVIFFSFTAAGLARGRDVTENGIRIKFFLIAKSVLPKVLTGFTILLSVIFYFTYFQWGGLTEAKSHFIMNHLLASANPVVAVIFSGASLDEDIDDFLVKFSESQFDRLSGSLLPPDLLPENLSIPGLTSDGPGDQFSEVLAGRLVKQESVKQMSVALKGSIEGFTGPIASGATVKDVLFQAAKKFIAGLAQNTPWVVPALGVAAAFLFFLTIKSFSFIIAWAVAFLAFMIYKILIAVRFARIEEKQVAKEEIVL